MKINLKKVLLAGTAIVAVSGFTATAAQAQTATLVGPTSWASGVAGAVDGDGTTASAGHDAVMTTFALTVSNDTVNDDGSVDTDTFALGAVTSTTGNIIITDDAAGGAALAVTLGSFTSTGTGDFSVLAADAAVGNVTTTVTGALNTGGALAVVNTEGAAQADLLTLNVGGALDVTGLTTITAAVGAGATAAVDVEGNATFTGLVTLQGGAGAGSDASLNLAGATNTFTGGLVLADGVAGVSDFILDGAVAQTVAGAIDGGGAAEGAIQVDNAAGVTFTGIIGATTLDDITIAATVDGTDSAATFQAAVSTANGIILGNGTGTDTNTVTFDGTTAGFAVTGIVDGTAGDTDDVIVSGTNIITQATAWGGAGGATILDSLTVTGTGTTLDSDAAIDATTLTIATGAILDQGAGLITAAVANSGTIQFTAGGDITGDITGAAGALDVDADTDITGSITQASADVATGVTLLVVGAAEAIDIDTVTLNGAAGTLEFTAGTSLTANVYGAATGNGIVNILDAAATTAIVGDLGQSGTTLAQFDIDALGGGAGAIVTTTGNLYVDAITADDAATLSFVGTSAQTVSGTITDGILNVGTGATATDVTFEGVIASMVTATVGAGASATFDAAATFTGALTNDGTLQVNSGNVLTVVGYAAGAGAGTYVLGVDRTGLAAAAPTVVGTNSAQITDLGAVDISADTLQINVEGGTLIAETYVDFITGVTVIPTIVDTVLYDFTGAIVGGDLDVTVVVNSLASLSSTASGAVAADIILNDATLAASVDADVIALRTSIQNATTDAAFNDAVEQAMPTVDGSSFAAAANVANTSFSIMGDRLASLRTGETVTGMTTGNMSQGLRAWSQVFGATGEQDRRDGVDGYDFDTYGVAVGIDSENVFEDTVMGIAFSYADTDADSDNGARTNTEVDSYQFTLYGDHDFENRIYLNGMASYTLNETDTSRTVAGATAKGDFDADQYTFRAEVGRDYEYDTATLTPHVLGHYTHYSADSYTETGAGGAGLVVSPDDMDIFEIGVGVDASWLFQNADGSHFSPELSIGYRYDFADDKVEASSTFVGGGAAFKTEGADAQQSTFELGAGFTYYSTDNWELSAEYDFEHKEDFDSHAGLFRAAYRF